MARAILSLGDVSTADFFEQLAPIIPIQSQLQPLNKTSQIKSNAKFTNPSSKPYKTSNSIKQIPENKEQQIKHQTQNQTRIKSLKKSEFRGKNKPFGSNHRGSEGERDL